GAVEWSTARLDHRGKDPVFITGQSSIATADPNRTQMILEDWVNNVRRQPVPRRVKGRGLPRQTIDSPVIGAGPNVTFAILVGGANVVAGYSPGPGIGA